MKISDLILKLDAMERREGDLEVKIGNIFDNFIIADVTCYVESGNPPVCLINNSRLFDER